MSDGGCWWSRLRAGGRRAGVMGVCGALALLAGCHARHEAPAQAQPGYFVRGQIESVDAKNGTVMLNHEAVRGLMPAMAMEYKLENPTVISELHAGDRITATMLADKSLDGPTNLRLTDLDVIAEARPDTLPASQYHVPAAGDLVPDFALLNQSGKRLDLRQFRGKVLALTFVYTRCPVADYCVRMSRNFAAMDKQLAADPALYAKTHLLTISFDPAYDTPKVLRSYGGAYTGRYSEETFTHWDFAVPSAAELPKVEEWFDLGVTTSKGMQFQHSLATAIVGPDGKVRAFYPTNEWTVAQALDAMRAAAAGAA